MLGRIAAMTITGKSFATLKVEAARSLSVEEKNIVPNFVSETAINNGEEAENGVPEAPSISDEVLGNAVQEAVKGAMREAYNGTPEDPSVTDNALRVALKEAEKRHQLTNADY